MNNNQNNNPWGQPGGPWGQGPGGDQGGGPPPDLEELLRRSQEGLQQILPHQPTFEVVAFSFGTVVAVLLARDWPNRISRLVRPMA